MSTATIDLASAPGDVSAPVEERAGIAWETLAVIESWFTDPEPDTDETVEEPIVEPQSRSFGC